MKIVCHPDNVKHLESLAEQGKIYLPNAPMTANLLYGVEVITEKHMEKDKPTGKYILPGGRKVERNQIRVREGRFTEWGHTEDEIKMLLHRGVIREERELVFIQLRDEWQPWF